MALLPNHVRELHKSGLTDETIAASGIRSIDQDEAREILNLKSVGCGGWCVGNGNGEFTTFKPDTPHVGSDGRPRKYLYPYNRPMRAFFPPGFDTSASVIIITEGLKKSLAGQQAGYDTIGLGGVFNFHKKRPRDTNGRSYGLITLIDDLDAIQWSRTEVYIAFDSDATTKPAVMLAEYRLAEVLKQRGGIVRVVRIPPGDGDVKVGLDDYLAKFPENDAQASTLGDLVKNAVEPSAPPKPGPMEVASEFLRLACSSDGVLTLRCHRDEYLEWNGSTYSVVPSTDLSKRVKLWLHKHFFNAKQAFTREVVEAIGAQAMIPSGIDLPVWCEGDDFTPISRLPLANGLLDLEETLQSSDSFRPGSTARFVSTVHLPYSYDPSATCPRWDGFLSEVLDPGSITLLQECFGYALVSDTTMHKFLLLVGEGSNGKSVTLSVLQAMIGKDNCCSVPVELFGTRFALVPTVGKLVNIAAEMDNKPPAEAEAIFKMFVAGDSITIDRKYLNPVTVKPTAFVVMAANDFPQWHDRSQGIWRRQLIIPFGVTIPPARQDRHLAQKIIEAELPGVLNWALAGLRRLRTNGLFTETDAGERATAEHRMSANPARAFLEDSCESSPCLEVASDELYKRYRDWCEENGYRPINNSNFGREVFRLFNVDRRQRGSRRIYVGIRLRE